MVSDLGGPGGMRFHILIHSVPDNRLPGTGAVALLPAPDGGCLSGNPYEETLSERCGSFQPGRTKWHVYPSG